MTVSTLLPDQAEWRISWRYRHSGVCTTHYYVLGTVVLRRRYRGLKYIVHRYLAQLVDAKNEDRDAQGCAYLHNAQGSFLRMRSSRSTSNIDDAVSNMLMLDSTIRISVIPVSTATIE